MKRILFVDDESNVRDGIRRMLHGRNAAGTSSGTVSGYGAADFFRALGGGDGGAGGDSGVPIADQAVRGSRPGADDRAGVCVAPGIAIGDCGTR